MNAKRWISEMTSFFESRAGDLAMVLGAVGCREGWIQAEVYRFFRKKDVEFETNTLPLPSLNGRRNRKADFAAYMSHDHTELQMIGELKVYGEHRFQVKGLCGGSVRPLQEAFRRRRSNVITNARWARELARGPSLLSDYFRLVDYAELDVPVRLLTLVVRRETHTDAFGRLLQTIEFERPGTEVLRTKHAWAKIWQVAQG